MLPVAQFIARQVAQPPADAPRPARIDARSARRQAEPDLDALAIEYLSSLPRRRRVSLALRTPSTQR